MNEQTTNETTNHTGEDDTEPTRHVARAELVLAKPDHFKIKDIGLDPDPLEAFARVFAELREDLDEHADVALDLLPLTPREQRRCRRRWLQGRPSSAGGLGGILRQLGEGLGLPGSTASGGQGGAEGWLAQLGVGLGTDLSGLAAGPAGQPSKSPAQQLADQAAARRRLEEAGRTDQLFEVQVLIRTHSIVEGRAKQLLWGLVACFDQWAGENWWRVRGFRLFGRHIGADELPWRRRHFDYRMDTACFDPPKRQVIGTRRLAGLLKPPTVRCRAPNVLRTSGVVAKPPPLPTYSGQPNLWPLGQVHEIDGPRPVGVPLSDTYFTYICGRSRHSGKTESSLVRFVGLIQAGHGGLFLDPHADALERVKPYLTDHADRVVELSIARGGDPTRQASWNPFSMAGLTEAALEDKFSAVVDAIAAATGWSKVNARALSITQMAARSLLELALILPDRLAPTIFQMTRLLADEAWRDEILEYLSPDVADYWKTRFPRLATEAITPVTNLLDRMRSSPTIASLLGASQSTYRIRTAMDTGQIVLVRLRGTSTIDRLIASFVVNDLLGAALSRVDLPPERRRPFHVFLDEVQSYDAATAGMVASLLEESAKYGLRLHLLNQDPRRLSTQTLQAVLTNRSHLACGAISRDAARLVARELGSEVDPATIIGLDKYQWITQVTVDGEVSAPFRMTGLCLEEAFGGLCDPEGLEGLQDQIAHNSGHRPTGEILGQLDTLDERILEHLRAGRNVAPLPTGNGSGPGAGPAPYDPGQLRNLYRQAENTETTDTETTDAEEQADDEQ